MERIYLTGFMASGKTRVGQNLARLMEVPFRDLDEAIEQRVGLTVTEIFGQQGEKAFRQLEFEELLATEDEPALVVATGGGAFTFSRNRETIRQAGISVWLHPDFDTIVTRLSPEGRARRPLFRDVDRARILHDERLPTYALADHEVEITAEETAPEVAARICALLRGKPCDT